jgi:metal-dependent HD superfamily phosphatase/phosphodiesterase
MARIQITREQRRYVNRGVEINLPAVYNELEENSLAVINKRLSSYPKAQRMFEALVADPEMRANLDMGDYIAVTKLNFNDHGEIHAKIVTASAVEMLNLLIEAGIEPDVIASGAGDEDDAFMVVTASALMHDIGNQVHRERHAASGAYLAIPILDRLMPAVYPDIEERVELRGFILHAIHCHGTEPEPLTIEAGIIAVADATDMTKGRGRMAFDLGNINIHSVSALAIEKVVIAKGNTSPIDIAVLMSNSAGIFQVQEGLLHKLLHSPLSGMVNITVTTLPEDVPTDQRIVHRLRRTGKNLVPA